MGMKHIAKPIPNWEYNKNVNVVSVDRAYHDADEGNTSHASAEATDLGERDGEGKE